MAERTYVTTKTLADHICVINHKAEFLGEIEFHKRWKKSTFVPDNGTFYDATCLRQIAKLLEEKDKK